MTSQPRDKTRDSTKHDTAKFGIDLYYHDQYNDNCVTENMSERQLSTRHTFLVH